MPTEPCVSGQTPLRERIAKALFDAGDFSVGEWGEWVDPARLPDDQDVEDWNAEYMYWDYATDEVREFAWKCADAVLSVLPGTDPEDAAAIRRVLEDAMRWRANMVNADVTIAATADDVARLARLGRA